MTITIGICNFTTRSDDLIASSPKTTWARMAMTEFAPAPKSSATDRGHLSRGKIANTDSAKPDKKKAIPRD
jgi:hypothetical protein